jgi:prepilin-type N-terminal cleavage/methylation domain-containing protein
MKSFTNSPRRSAAAFTLIELLTVIAIIGILAAILIPTVSAVREKAKQVQCSSNVRDWGRAIMMYAAENKNRYAIRDGNGYWYQYSTSASNTVYGTYFGLKRGDYAGVSGCPVQATKEGGSSLENTHFLMTRPSQDIGGTPLTANLVPISKIRSPSKYVLMVERAYPSANSADNPVVGSGYEDMQVTNQNARANAQGFVRHSKKLNTLGRTGT